jgi:hypothetical protein
MAGREPLKPSLNHAGTHPGANHTDDLVHLTRGHRQGPWPRLNRQEQCAHRIEGRPPPGARRRKALDGIGFTHLIMFESTDHGVQRIGGPLFDVHVTEERTRKGLELLGGFDQPWQHCVGVYLKHAGRGAHTYACRQARQHADDQLD